MPANVYFHPLAPASPPEEVQRLSRELLAALVEREGVALRPEIPLKVHFGEAKNATFLKPETYLGVIGYLEERGVAPCFIETSVLYGGERARKETHAKLAEDHGFTRLPVVFADGDAGEEYEEVPIHRRHFDTFKVGRAFADYDQVLVLSHFKGHHLAGFGGAIKQLAMGFAAKGGKLAIHLGEKPRIRNRRCTRCGTCLTRCGHDAIHIGEHKGERSWIDQDRCVGCGACVAMCRHKAATLVSFRNLIRLLGVGNPFIEKLVEGAYAAQLGKKNLYLNFAMDITAGCDCEPRRMKPLMPDVGILASTDPVAVDKACFDLCARRGHTFRRARTFAYAEAMGLGSASYALHRLG